MKLEAQYLLKLERWQVQYLAKLKRHFSWQVHYLVEFWGWREQAMLCFSTQRRPGCPKGTSSANGRVADVMFGSWCALRWTFHLLPLSNLNIVVTLPFASYRLLVTCAFASHIDCCVLCTGRFMCYQYSLNVAVALAFASHRLLRPVCWTFPVLPLSNNISNMNVVTCVFASQSLMICRMFWMCHVLPL